jgi:hypothetical protein
VAILGNPLGLAVLASACVIGLACSGDDDARSTAPSSSGTATDTTSTRFQSAGGVTSFEFVLGKGASEARTPFEAEDPRENSQTVTVIASRPDVSLTLAFVTTGGSTLHLLEAGSHRGGCHAENGRTVCTIRFPSLEAQLPGEWQAIASKTDGDAVDVEVSIAWELISTQ